MKKNANREAQQEQGMTTIGPQALNVRRLRPKRAGPRFGATAKSGESHAGIHPASLPGQAGGPTIGACSRSDILYPKETAEGEKPPKTKTRSGKEDIWKKIYASRGSIPRKKGYVPNI